MSNLFFQFELANSLLAEKQLAEKSPAPTNNAAHASAFDALLREQMSEGQNDGLPESLPESLPENLPESLKADPSESLAEEFNLPNAHSTAAPASTASTDTEPAPPANQSEASFKDAADEPVDAYSIAPLPPTPGPKISDDAAEPGEQTNQAAPPGERAAETPVTQAARHNWHFDRNLPREPARLSARTPQNRQPNPQVNPAGATVRDQAGPAANSTNTTQPREAAHASAFTFAEPTGPQAEKPGSAAQAALLRTTQKARHSLSAEPLQPQPDGANTRVPQPVNAEPTTEAVIELPQQLSAAAQTTQLATAVTRQAEGFKQTRVLPAEPFVTATPSHHPATSQPTAAAPAQAVEGGPTYAAPAPSHSQADPALPFGLELPPTRLGTTSNAPQLAADSEQAATTKNSEVSTRSKSPVPEAAPLDSAVRPALEQVNEAVELAAGNFDKTGLTASSLPKSLPDGSKPVAAEPANARAASVPAATQPEPVSKPLTVGQVVHIVLKEDGSGSKGYDERQMQMPEVKPSGCGPACGGTDKLKLELHAFLPRLHHYQEDYPFAWPATPNAPPPPSTPAKPELRVPQATPVTTESTIPQTQPGTAGLIAAKAEPTATMLLKPQTAAAPPSATTIVETATPPVPRPTLDGMQPQPVRALSEARTPPALRDTDDWLAAARQTPFSTVLPERLSKAGQRTFQLVLQPPAPAPPQTQPAFDSELPNESALVMAAQIQRPAQQPLPLQATSASSWPSTEPKVTAEPNARVPQDHTLSVSEPGSSVAAVQDTQVITPLDHCEAEMLPPKLVTEPLRASLSKIEQHFSNPVQQLGSNAEVATQSVPALSVNSTPPSSESLIPGLQQADTVRELRLPQFYQAELAEPAANSPETVSRNLTDEWLGQRQIPDRQAPPTTIESVGTLTPLTAVAAQNTTPIGAPRPAATIAPAYFSTNVPAHPATHSGAANSVSNNWPNNLPAAQQPGGARWATAINPVTRQVASTLVKEELPSLALGTPFRTLSDTVVEVPLPENYSARTADLPTRRPVPAPLAANTEPAPAQPAQRVEPLVTAFAENTPLTTTPHAAASLREARRIERAVDNKAPAAPLLARAAPQVTPAATPEAESSAAPAVRRPGVELNPPAKLEAARAAMDETPVNDLAAAPLTPERGTAVAQHVGIRDENVSHVARQLAEPVITASAELERNEPRTIRLKLRPAALGAVEIELRYDAAGQLNARLTAEREQTTHVLRGQLGQLREALEQAGLQVGTLDINTSPDQRGQGWHAGGQDARHAHTPLTRIPAPESFAFEPTPQGGLAPAQDRLINLHA